MTLPQRVVAGRALPWTLFVLAAAAAVAFAVLWSQERSEAARRAERVDELEATARRFVEALTTFSSDTIEEDVEEIRSFAVGRFEREVDDLFSEQTVRAIEEAEATSSSEVEAVFVQRLGESSATVFAVASVTVDNARIDGPTTEVVRMEIGLLRTEAGWKVEEVELFQAPSVPGAA